MCVWCARDWGGCGGFGGVRESDFGWGWGAGLGVGLKGGGGLLGGDYLRRAEKVCSEHEPTGE